jgi:hypothetical protein
LETKVTEGTSSSWDGNKGKDHKDKTTAVRKQQQQDQQQHKRQLEFQGTPTTGGTPESVVLETPSAKGTQATAGTPTTAETPATAGMLAAAARPERMETPA